VNAEIKLLNLWFKRLNGWNGEPGSNVKNGIQAQTGSLLELRLKKNGV
jgi:hypothetical protein